MASPAPDYTADDLDPAYGSHGTQPNGVNLTPEQRQLAFNAFIDACYEGKSIRKALKNVGLAWGTVSRWLATNEEWAAQYALAKDQGAEMWAERAVKASKKEARTMVEAQTQRLRADVAKWRASTQSRRWSEKQTIDVNVTATVNVLHLDLLRHRNTDEIPEAEQVKALNGGEET